MTQTNYRGSCLCGALEYEITGETERFYHCHCQRCRKATGTGHASNLFIKADKVNWLKGEQYLVEYKVPEAERFTNCFCKQCGSRMPRFVPQLSMVMLPAGSLDIEPEEKPQIHIFWGSRASWSCEAGELPVADEYPTNK